MKQKEAFEILKLGHNVFLTGQAGSGKTYLLNKYIEYIKNNNVNVSVTASTGIAATHIDGRTIHSWAGIGIDEHLTESQIKNLKENDNVYSRIALTKVLVIDEISMLSANRLDLVDHVCKAVRQDLRPFGGMQVIMSGDFFQLPPVAKGKEDNRFVSESRIWNNMNIKICYLDEQHRQEDKNFLKILNDIREDNVTKSTYDILKWRLNAEIESDIKPTKLYTHNSDVDVQNISELNKLEGKERVYEMYSEGIPFIVKTLKENCLAPERLRVKEGAVVMFVKNNFSKGYVNGTLGKIIGFNGDNGFPIVETFSGEVINANEEKWIIEDGGETLASIYQVPLRLAWAITVHKSQGMSLDCAEIDLSKTFEYGMGYVALSRVRSLAGISLMGINKKALEVNEDVILLNRGLLKESKKDLEAHLKISKKIIRDRQKEFIDNNKDDNSGEGIFNIIF